MKLISWNVNGIRAAVKKGAIADLKDMDADVYAFQETKATPEQVQEALAELDGYEVFANGADKKGYSGTAVAIRKSLNSKFWKDLDHEEHDGEGRVVHAEFENFILVNTYVPNSKSALERLDYRQEWDAYLLKHLKELETKKPVVLCGDLNVAHKDIDLARPKENYGKSAGFTQEEINGIDNFVNGGFVDSFRHLHPDKVQYTWWSFRGGARQRNVGWRIDYFLVSEKLKPQISDAFIMDQIMGSDHCPVGLILS
ncbi:exodeoxyribonuclease III [Luteibaculum oceani]|uniref:Exodeoxyribonuclease III n=1 Tax=Luteibaculum oceani TaxID=1294296 RepID=A0A5C6UZZ7_9FLAO|nr:exodeoxyribonuclease III [Luteibaculum oceani]TXC78807.1 exodeoxyribonuclease III [Luteibaculum oceani]